MPRGSRNTPEHLRLKERDGVQFAILEDMYMSGETIEPFHLAEWKERSESGPRQRIIRGKKAVAQAPESASRYTEKTFVFPTGVLRELVFKEADGGMLRALTVENYLYILEGNGALEMNGETIEIVQGHAVKCCHGAILRGVGDAKVIAWTVSDTREATAPSNHSDTKLAVLRSDERKVDESAQWDVDGERYVARTEEDRSRAPKDAIRLKIEVADFGCNVVGVVNGYQGGPTYEAASTFDNYLYITSGAYRYFQDDVEFEARPGDVIREISGHYHHWIRHEDSSFLVVSSLPVPKAS